MALSAQTRLELGSRLRTLRLARGATANTVAHDALGLQTSRHAAVTRLERGVLKLIPSDQLQKLALYYGVALHDLLPTGATMADLVCREADGPAATVEPQEPPTSQPAGASAPPVASVERVVRHGVPMETPVPSLQARIRQLRLQLGLSVATFAQRLNTSQDHVSEKDVLDWESAARRPTPGQYAALERVTGANTRWIKTGHSPA